MSQTILHNIDSYQRISQKISRNLYALFILWLTIHLALVGIFYLLDALLGTGLSAAIKNQIQERLIRVTTENINEDREKRIRKTTRLGKEDSKGRGALTKRKGVNALTPYLNFQRPLVSQRTSALNKKGQNQKKPSKSDKLIVSSGGRVSISFAPDVASRDSGARMLDRNTGTFSKKQSFRIPEHYRFRKKFALNISNDSRDFSFNTLKYPDYKYFQDMKKKIQMNWNRNVPAGGMYLGSMNQAYYPGLSRVVSFKPGNTQIAFGINRAGKIFDIKILKKHPSKIITESCFKAIEDSREFGPLPESIKGDQLIIPLNFIYNLY